MSTAELSRPALAWPRLARSLMPLVLLGLIGSEMAMIRCYPLFSRRLWLDEFHTLLLVQDPSFSHSMEALKHGADTNAPGLYLIGRAVSWCVGSASPDVLRSIGVVSTLLGVFGIYAAVRRVYSPWVGLIAAMVTWSHPQITHQAFEARFYGPWFAAIVWFAYSLNLWDRSSRKLWPGLLTASTSVLVCTIHYLGIISLVLVVSAHLLFVRRPWKATLARLVPIGVGPLALAACIPLYLGQRQSVSVPTWIDPPTIAAVRDFLELIFSYYLFAIPVIGYFVSEILGRGREDGRLDGSSDGVSELAGLASLAVLPAAFVVFSFLIQSVLIDRYAIAAVASFGPIIAPIVARTRPSVRWAVLAGLLLLSTSNLMAVKHWYQITEARRLEATAEVAKLPDVPILFRYRADLYEMWWDAPAARDRLYFWDPKDLAEHPRAFDRLERDMAKNHERWFGLSRSGSLAALRDHPVVYLYGLDASGALEVERSEPGLRLRSVDPKRGLFEASRSSEKLSKRD